MHMCVCVKRVGTNSSHSVWLRVVSVHPKHHICVRVNIGYNGAVGWCSAGHNKPADLSANHIHYVATQGTGSKGCGGGGGMHAHTQFITDCTPVVLGTAESMSHVGNV